MNVEALMNFMKQNGTEVDPKFAMLAQMMSNQNKTIETTTTSEEIRPSINKIKYMQRIKSLKQENQMLKNGLEQTLLLIDEISDLLGACGNCFGKDPECTLCHGKGKPGNFTFDKRAFYEFIKPCLQQVNNEINLTEK
jgi:hypothetical protein